LLDMEKWGRDIEAYFETLPLWRWLLNPRSTYIGPGGQPEFLQPGAPLLGGSDGAEAGGGGIGGWWKRTMPGWLGGGGAGSGAQSSGAVGAGRYTLAQMVQLAKNAGFQGDDAAHIAALAMAESGGNPNAKGGAGELGLTQINPHAHGQDAANRALDPQGAFNEEYKVYRSEGFGAWSTDPSSRNFTPGNSGMRYIDAARRALNAPVPSATSQGGGYNPNAGLPTDVGTDAPGSAPADIFMRAPFAARSKLLNPQTGKPYFPVPVPYVAPSEDPNAAALGRASSIDTSKTISSNVTNTVNVYGSGDPHTAAAMVGLHLDRNVHDLTSNLQGNVQ
jgi:hypothetical protein